MFVLYRGMPLDSLNLNETVHLCVFTHSFEMTILRHGVRMNYSGSICTMRGVGGGHLEKNLKVAKSKIGCNALPGRIVFKIGP